MKGPTKAGLKGNSGMFMEVNLSVAVSRAWASPDVKGDLEQWEEFPDGSGNVWEEHGP